MTLALPAERRGFALGLLSTGTYVGLAVGPPLGGSLVAALGWRSVFWASLGVTAVALGFVLWVIPRGPGAQREARFDWSGSVVTAVGTLAFLLLATRGPSWGLRSAATGVCAALSIVLLPVFIWIESRHPAPTLDLRLFKSVVFSSAAISAMLNYASMFIALFAIPFALRDGQGMSPPQVGRVLGAQALGMALFAWGSGTLSDRIGSRGLASTGMIVLGIGMGGLAWCWPVSGALVPAVWLFVCGAGTGLFVSPNSSALMGSAPRNRQGIAGGVMSLARNLGMSLGVAAASALLAPVFGDTHTPALWPPGADRALQIALIVAASAALLAGVVAFAGRPSGAGVQGPVQGDVPGG
jgi:MFS family permease